MRVRFFFLFSFSECADIIFFGMKNANHKTKATAQSWLEVKN